MSISLNAAQPVAFTSNTEAKEDIKNEYTPELPEMKPDTVEFTTKEQAAPKEYDGPEIGFFRLMFNRLTDEQITAINRSGKLPGNAKFTRCEGGFIVANNIFNMSYGTTTLPAGYEVRKDSFGFSHVVPKDTEGLFLKDKKYE